MVAVLEHAGLTAVLPEAEALETGLTVLFGADRITPTVQPDLQAIAHGAPPTAPR